MRDYRKSKWWIRLIRERNYFGFRYWWFNWLLLLGACLAFYLLWSSAFSKLDNCGMNGSMVNVNIVIKELEKCCPCQSEVILEDSVIQSPPIDTIRSNDSIPKVPEVNCRVHFSGLVIGGKYEANNISKVYRVDQNSEYVGSGFYSKNIKAFPKSVASTFDGIAIDKGTRLIIYSKPNFKGDVLLDVIGPMIINNEKWKNDSRYNHCNTDVFPDDLQRNFPPSVRKWSNSNMHDWSYGSCKIFCN